MQGPGDRPKQVGPYLGVETTPSLSTRGSTRLSEARIVIAFALALVMFVLLIYMAGLRSSSYGTDDRRCTSDGRPVDCAQLDVMMQMQEKSRAQRR